MKVLAFSAVSRKILYIRIDFSVKVFSIDEFIPMETFSLPLDLAHKIAPIALLLHRLQFSHLFTEKNYLLKNKFQEKRKI